MNGQAGGVSLAVSDLLPGSQLSEHWDHLVDRTEGIDRWCTRLPWARSVDAAFGHRFTDDDDGHDEDDGPDDLRPVARDDAVPEPGPDVVEVDERWAYAFRQRHLADGTPVLVPLDSVWAFASPLVVDQVSGNGRDLRGAARSAADSLLRRNDWQVAFLTGVERESKLFVDLARKFSDTLRVVEGESTVRCVASLDGGVEGFLSRRPRTFRRNLRSAARSAEAAGIRFESADAVTPGRVVERLQSVEKLSWKGLQGSGITAPDMANLYMLLIGELHRVRGLRVSFAVQDGLDVGFILGGVLGSSYRGLQISFVEEARTLSIGNLLQFHEITRLCEEGIGRYDLGMDMPYKRTWSDRLMATTPMVLIR
jgi:Acetyltransferase (GNAT) domain